MRRLGMRIPVRTYLAARGCGLSLPLACSLLTQESAGGLNEYGHDRDARGDCPGFGWGQVTRTNYRRFRALRDAERRSNGVGPCQLTYPGFQDDADRQGGCWRPLVNMRVGFAVLAANVRRDGLHAGVAAYNGSGPAAERYADEVLARARGYAARLHLAPP